MPKGFIMMTALPPTKGHLALINFAVAYGKSYGLSEIHVMVCSQPNEPYRHRWYDLARAIPEGYVYVHDFHKEMPQNPEDHHEFWGLWQSQIYATVGPFADDDIVFSSEPYGYPLARVLGCKHIPYDISRDVTWAKASNVRKDPVQYWYSLIEPTQRRYQKTVTIFGAESTGKTTLSKCLAETYNSRFLPEWARPYLESLPSPETTDERMEIIVHGQRALEQSAKALPSTPFLFRDTDLLSTVGYYGIYSKTTPAIGIDKADLYLLCRSNVPFTPDPLRYGGDKRESTDEYWEDLLKDYGCDYRTIDSLSYSVRLAQALGYCDDLLKEIDWYGFKRT